MSIGKDPSVFYRRKINNIKVHIKRLIVGAIPNHEHFVPTI
jgi:hypothetical protein